MCSLQPAPVILGFLWPKATSLALESLPTPLPPLLSVGVTKPTSADPGVIPPPLPHPRPQSCLQIAATVFRPQNLSLLCPTPTPLGSRLRSCLPALLVIRLFTCRLCSQTLCLGRIVGTDWAPADAGWMQDSTSDPSFGGPDPPRAPAMMSQASLQAFCMELHQGGGVNGLRALQTRARGTRRGRGGHLYAVTNGWDVVGWGVTARLQSPRS